MEVDDFSLVDKHYKLNPFLLELNKEAQTF
jgi:hypothetical protein